MARDSRQFMPKDGKTLKVGIVARISGCASQKEISLEDQVEHGKEEATALFSGPIEYTVIATKGKGEQLDRPELEEIESLLRSGHLDLLVVEDMGRLVRGSAAHPLCGLAVDRNTRVISPNDAIDTWDETWEEDVLEACADHVGYNAHTSKRIKHKLMTRFKRNGSCAKRPIAGYIVPAEATTYSDWRLDAAATPVIAAMFTHLFDGRSYEMIADHLNQIEFGVGPGCHRKKWYGKMVARYMSNPLLSGRPQRGTMHTVKVHETGHRVSVKNPAGPTYFDAPHLAHVSVDTFERARAMIDARRSTYAVKPVNGKDPRANVPRRDSRFPGGGCARCYYCGRPMVWGGNGVTENLQCAGSRDWKCWNSLGFSGSLATKAITDAISAELFRLDGFAGYFAEKVEAARHDDGGRTAAKLRVLDRRRDELERQKTNVQNAIREFGPDPTILESLKAVNGEAARLQAQRNALSQLQTSDIALPNTPGELRAIFEETFSRLTAGSAEFAHELRKIVTRVDVYLVRSIDGGHPLPRARVTLSLDSVCPPLRDVDGLYEILVRELSVDLFVPAQRIRILPMVTKLIEQGLTHDQIADRIAENPTSTAVQKSASLGRMMISAGLTDPFVLLKQPPPDYAKLRRHLNARYRFESLVGYSQLPI